MRASKQKLLDNNEKLFSNSPAETWAKGPREAKGVLSMLDIKYTITQHVFFT